jgi:gamma-polyglutamate synthase
MIDRWLSALLPGTQAIAPASLFLVAMIVCLFVCAFLCWLAFTHKRRLAGIPLRIHVAGTRGKSTSVRLIAAGLRAGGYRVVAKVTGRQPTIILPDGSEQPLRRRGAAAIREQRAFIATAHRLGANALVAEAMAVEPEYLHALERFYICATDLVITNVRPDHQEQLGPAAGAMADAVSQTIPAGGRLFLTPEAGVPVILARAAAQNCEVAMVTGDPAGDPEDANCRLALAVCERHGVAPADGENATRRALEDIGPFALTGLRIDGRTLSFANAFSCNDVQSFELLWRRHQPMGRPAAFVLNARSDRPLRSSEFLKMLVRLAPNRPLFIIGEGTGLRRQALALGFAPQQLHRLSRPISEDTLRVLSSAVDDGTVVWGVGNYRGAGARLSALAETARAPC